MKKVFKVKDKVFDYSYGWGKIESIDKRDYYPVTVMFDIGSVSYTFEGAFLVGAKPTLSFTEYTQEGFSQERPVTFEEGEWIAVSEDGKYWGIIEFTNADRCSGGTLKNWKHIKKLQDFNK